MTTVTAKRVFGSSQAITWTNLQSLATSSTRLGYCTSPAIDLAGFSPPPVDVLMGGRIKTASSGLAAGAFELLLAGSEDGTNYAGGVTAGGTGTLTAEQKALLKLIAMIATNATASTTYEISPFSLAQKYGGLVLPRKFILVATQNSGGALVSPSAFSWTPQTVLSE